MLTLNRMARKTLVLLLLTSLFLAACTPGEEESETHTTSSGFVCPEPEERAELESDELNLFVWTEYLPQDWFECFEAVYNITVNREEFSSTEEMYAKISAGGSNYDLIQPTDYIVQLMVREGLLQKIDKSRLTIMDNFSPNYLNLPYDPNNEYTIPYQFGTDAIVYNSDAVTTPPTAWEDLWNPEYEGRLVMLADSRAVIGAALLTLGYDPNTTDPTQLEEAKAKLTELVPNVRLFDSDSPKTALIAGDVDLGMTWTAEAVLASRENPAIQYIYPTEGAMLWMDNYGIPAEAPHLDATYAWLNYTMQGNMFWLMLRDFPYTNPNQSALDYAQENQADLYNDYINSPVTNVPAEAVANGHFLTDVGDATPLYDRLWTEVIGE